MPTTLRGACELLADAVTRAEVLRPMAGATDLLVHWPMNHALHDQSFLDLSKVTELKSIDWSDEALTLGAGTTYWDVLCDERALNEFPLLSQAARQVGCVQIQSRGTWAGNIANGSPAADGVPVLMAYDARVTLVSTNGTRSVPLSEYSTGYRQSVRRADELIADIVLPRRSYDLNIFHKVGARNAQAITKIGLAMTRSVDERAGGWRIVASSVAPTIRRCAAIERLLVSGSLVTSPNDMLPAALLDVAPIDDIRSTAEYRRTVLCRLLYHSLKGVCPSVR